VNNTLQIQHDCNFNYINRLFITSFILVSSIVIADQNLPLDLNLTLDSGNIDSILDRNDWREAQEEDNNNWRQKSNIGTKKYTWGAISIYEENKKLEPIMPGANQSSNVIDKREAAPKFQLRF
jgi:hypothetical protein